MLYLAQGCTMAMEGLFALVCATALGAGGVASATPTATEDRDASVSTALAVQTALQQGRDYLLHNNPRAAVQVLENELPRINGNPVYLSVLRDAYRAYLKSLSLAGQDATVQIYRKRLLILDPQADLVAIGKSTTPVAPPKTASTPSAAAAAIFRAKQDDDPFQQSSTASLRRANELLAQAERAFGQSQFRDADILYGRAHEIEPGAIAACRERWAYCKMYCVVEKLNQHATSYPALEGEVRQALGLQVGPRIESYGKQLLAEIEKRRNHPAGSLAEDSAWSDLPIRDLGRMPEGWSVAETTNFRIYHNLPPESLRPLATVAERTRSEMHRKWFADNPPSWNPKCELYLHATAQEYSRATGVSPMSPGHSSFQLDGSRVLSRRIDLHCDDPGMLIGVLPHETTHVVLAGKFGEQPVPRWADEGMAVLTEPRDKIERHLRNLPRHRQERQLFALRQLVNMNDYPAPQYVGAFYAQSVSLVEFLSAEKGPATFTQFVRDGMRNGYDSALTRYYGYRSFDELEERWHAYAFGDAAADSRGRGDR
jgi:hypothetical protein